MNYIKIKKDIDKINVGLNYVVELAMMQSL